MLVSTCWLSHLQHDWESPVWRHFLDEVGRFATIVRYDERGYGLSDWDVTDYGLEPRIGDLEAVADHAGFDRFALMGMAQGGPPAIAYAHPPPRAGDPAAVLRQLRRRAGRLARRPRRSSRRSPS